MMGLCKSESARGRPSRPRPATRNEPEEPESRGGGAAPVRDLRHQCGFPGTEDAPRNRKASVEFGPSGTECGGRLARYNGVSCFAELGRGLECG